LIDSKVGYFQFKSLENLVKEKNFYNKNIEMSIKIAKPEENYIEENNSDEDIFNYSDSVIFEFVIGIVFLLHHFSYL
jgi:hypothetical protein